MTTIYFSKLDSGVNDPNEMPFEPNQCTMKSLFGKPQEIGHFSINSGRKIHFDKSQMKYLISPLKTKNLNYDLNVNFSSDTIHRYVTLEKMYQILYWLKNYKQNSFDHAELSLKMSNVDFVTVRGTLVRVMCTPYFERNSVWEICASKLDGIIYFSAIDTDEQIAKDDNPTLKYFLSQSWGYKFEQYLTTDKIDGDPDLSSTTHQLEEFCIVLKNVLNNHSLLYKAEIDAVVPYRHSSLGFGDTSCYTELKTYKIRRTVSENVFFSRYRTSNWWAQSYLAGVPEIICGNRTDDGIVKSLEILRVSSLPDEARGLWSKDVCLNFCDRFLNFLKKTVTEDDINTVYKFRFRDGQIYCTKLANPEKRYRVIPEWYKKH